MKRIKLFYWIVTVIFAVFMFMTALPDAMLSPEAQVFMRHLGYPDYMTRFIGAAKMLGAIAILIPGFPRIKEWAYAGFCFDLFGATFSVISADGLKPESSFMFVIVAFFFLAYWLWRKKEAQVTAA